MGVCVCGWLKERQDGWTVLDINWEMEPESNDKGGCQVHCPIASLPVMETLALQ